MELVTLVHGKFHRIGSATRGGFSGCNYKTLEKTQEIANDDLETLRDFVLSVAEKNGDTREALKEMTAEPIWGKNKSPTIFHASLSNTFHSTPYAECKTFTAMKIEGRYFKLEEIEI